MLMLAYCSAISLVVRRFDFGFFDTIRLSLAETRTYGGQVIYERYRRVRDDA